jgi:hypothetical protein
LDHPERAAGTTGDDRERQQNDYEPHVDPSLPINLKRPGTPKGVRNILTCGAINISPYGVLLFHPSFLILTLRPVLRTG